MKQAQLAKRHVARAAGELTAFAASATARTGASSESAWRKEYRENRIAQRGGVSSGELILAASTGAEIKRRGVANGGKTAAAAGGEAAAAAAGALGSWWRGGVAKAYAASAAANGGKARKY
jgi:hypothetical protein